MTTKKTALQKLEEQRAQVDARIKALKAREKAQQRKDDNRRKILIGAIAQEHMARFPDGEFAAHMRQLLNDHLSRPQDRDLLGLAPRPAPSSDPHAPANESAKPGEPRSMPWMNPTG